MCLHSCVCVCRKGAPCDAQGQFGITQCSAKAIWQTWGVAGTSGAVWDKAGQDRTGRGRAGQWHVRQQETAMPSHCTPFRWHRFASIHTLLIRKRCNIYIDNFLEKHKEKTKKTSDAYTLVFLQRQKTNRKIFSDP